MPMSFLSSMLKTEISLVSLSAIFSVVFSGILSLALILWAAKGSQQAKIAIQYDSSFGRCKRLTVWILHYRLIIIWGIFYTIVACAIGYQIHGLFMAINCLEFMEFKNHSLFY